jgi:FolB domain-containing protein
MDRIEIEGISCLTYIGVPHKEREQLQELHVDVTLEVDLDLAAEKDSFSDAVDYQQIVDLVQKTARDSIFSLIEAMALELCKQILENERVFKATVKVRKYPQELRGRIDHVAVELTRTRKL